jgi:hypothetical protein
MSRRTVGFMRMLLVLAVCGLGVIAATAPAEALLFELTSDHCTGGCGTPPFGTVDVVQNGANVDITVSLAAGYSYVQTGAADDQAFKFNGVDVVLGDITVDAHVPALVAATGAFNGNGTGEFDFGINCPTCATGGAGAFTGDIVFHVANATIGDLTVANNLGNLFVADVLAPNGNTGPVDVSGAPVPEPATLFLIGTGMVGIGMWRRKWGQNAPQNAA